MGGRQGEALAAAAAARGAGYNAWRTYYMGHAALAAAGGSNGADRLAEAAALFRRAGQKASQAIELVQVGATADCAGFELYCQLTLQLQLLTCGL